MLEKVDLTKEISKSDYKDAVAELSRELRNVQHRQWQANLPIILVFEGWDCAGKGESISLITNILDPRGFRMHPIFEPTALEASYPFLWRFWTKTPGAGEIALFDRSWYQRVLTDRVDKVVKKAQWKRAYEQISSFERQLADSGVLILKFFLHISRKEQRKRFKKFESDPHESWRVRKEDWKHHDHYDDFVEAAEEMFFRTESHYAPWHIIPAEDLRYAQKRVLEITLKEAESALKKREAALKENLPSQSNPQPPPPESFEANAEGKSLLDKIDLNQKADKDKYKSELRELQTRLRHLTWEMYNRGIPSVLLYQGWDAAGKGGNIKRLTSRLDPRVYDVVAIQKPTQVENRHHYLWRFWNQMPRNGHMTIFDRSWYGRVLVERVEGFCSEEEWRRAYGEINQFEAQLADHGMVIVKFFVHIDKEEQAQRFRAREETPHKRWKIGKEDWRNREKWDLHEAAAVDMFQRTSTPHAPWTIIPGNDKKYARLEALRHVIGRFEARLAE